MKSFHFMLSAILVAVSVIGINTIYGQCAGAGEPYLVWQAPGGTLTNYSVLTAGTGISFSGSSGQTIVNNSGVRSVGLSMPSIFSVSGSPVTTTGTLTA